MKAKLYQYITNFKEKNQALLSEYLTIQTMIDEFERSEKSWTPHSLPGYILIQATVENLFSQFQEKARQKDCRHINQKITKLLYDVLRDKLGLFLWQMNNRYRSMLIKSYEEATDISVFDSDGEDAKCDALDSDDIILEFFSQLILSDNRFCLPLAINCPDSEALDFALITLIEEHLDRKQKYITHRFNVYFTLPEVLVWGMKRSAGEVFDLSDGDISLLQGKKWHALARIYKITGKKTLILQSHIKPALVLDSFLAISAPIETLVCHNIEMFDEKELEALGAY